MKQEGRDYLDGSILVWMAHVSTPQDSLSSLESSLDDHEHERAARFHFPEDRARFVLGRGLLRKCLGTYLRQPPETIKLGYTARGRPILARDQTIQFSISHTHDLVAIALTAQARVGIDLEYVQADLDPLELAGRIFSPEDLQTFCALPDHERSAVFFRAWTRKEAYLKACGEGISEGLQLVSVSFGAEETASLADARDDSAARNWRLHVLPVSADYMGSVACDDARKRLDFHPVHLDKGEVILDSPNLP